MSGGAHEGHRERVRHRYLNEGLDKFEDHQILELLLFYCIPVKDTNELAHCLLKEFGSLSSLFEAKPQEIEQKCRVTENTAVLISMIPALAQRYFRDRWSKRQRLASAEDAGAFLMDMFVGHVYEAFYAICLDRQRRLINAALVNEGTVDEAPVYIRNVLKPALLHHAANIIIAHNHPGGSRRPSGADVEATRQIINAFQYMGIDVLDHIVVAGDSYYSFSSNGLLGLHY
jgi:DNA repair protein RadC